MGIARQSKHYFKKSFLLSVEAFTNFAQMPNSYIHILFSLSFFFYRNFSFSFDVSLSFSVGDYISLHQKLLFIHFLGFHSCITFAFAWPTTQFCCYCCCWYYFAVTRSLTKSSKTWNGRLSCRGGTSSNHIDKPSKHATSNRLSFTKQVKHLIFFFYLSNCSFLFVNYRHFEHIYMTANKYWLQFKLFCQFCSLEKKINWIPPVEGKLKFLLFKF